MDSLLTRLPTVTEPAPLDLALFNHTADPFGAHVGVWTDDDRVLHLCAEVGRPRCGHWRSSRPASATGR
ncbi:hypothetical protein GCM10017786_64090 [Amycolatopsis deserti]|uniref:Uncharacterized protein n=1 Tax=Amycolatopsis deserti TaxID=185696 RepID=A0ABQ3JCJ7_9PSEU|nr:hypothetical protein [Amycolatopsis deserti]GHF21315.1 hypothetical protein GCM10017786_64090 [Amycolatopsis deserti]